MTAYVGIDVGARLLDAWDEEAQRHRQVRNTPAGVRALCAWLGRNHPQGGVQAVVEPTSVYHHLLLTALDERGIAYTVINPRRTAVFAQEEGSRAKTDRADARALARMGAEKRLAPTLRLDAEREELKYLRRQAAWLREQLQEARNRRETMRRSPLVPEQVTASLDEVIRGLEQGIEAMEQELREWLAAHPGLQAELRLVATVKGIGWRTAVLIVAEFPSVQACPTAKAWVAYAGLNPAVRQSGKRWRAALSRMGPAGLRKGLYWPAIVALRANPAIACLGERLEARGKLSKQIIVAGMAKLVRQAFGVLKSGTPFDPHRGLRPALDGQHGI
jgi:transposase